MYDCSTPALKLERALLPHQPTMIGISVKTSKNLQN
jgi:hypothetical protein